MLANCILFADWVKTTYIGFTFSGVLPGEEEDVRSSNDATLRSSARSVEMELDSSDLASKSVSCLYIIS